MPLLKREKKKCYCYCHVQDVFLLQNKICSRMKKKTLLLSISAYVSIVLFFLLRPGESYSVFLCKTHHKTRAIAFIN